MHPTTIKTYAERAKLHPNPTARRLLEIMERKKSNLAVSVDVTTVKEVLDIVRSVGTKVCCVKTHCDIIQDFTLDFAKELVRLSQQMDFIIFEDRKFADIGNTVTLQYSAGLHRISSWADLTNAHPLPGPGIISGLSSVGQPLGRGLLLLAEMSSKDNLATGQYTTEAVQMARQAGRGFVVGFIAMNRVDIPSPVSKIQKVNGMVNGHGHGNASVNGNGNGYGGDKEMEDYLILTPGVQLSKGGDTLGQQYRTPHQVIFDSGCDVIIVGRGIYAVKGKEAEVAEEYRKAAWEAYERRLRC
ncbi:orotidine 5'-phosphate decarboxylase [Tremella mesenterica]|uniref:Orotidine 5'-phosphate decarboxylase n=1 Tax=Tremella mesenterica TaxID=5217 RepID=A0A4Q1BIP0_TREME|nr:orotidine 5'-phosphate decarboxylase [Tremella mesenterica]